MRFKLVEDKFNESGLSRLWQHTQDSSTFAIIGSKDKDTHEDRSKELKQLINNQLNKHQGKISYKELIGVYKYDDGSIDKEISYIIFGIMRENALNIMRKINQESFIWKDDNFFGIIDSSNSEVFKFTNNSRNMSFNDDDLKNAYSQLVRNKSKNQTKPFTFIVEAYKYEKSFGFTSQHLASEPVVENLLEIRVE